MRTANTASIVLVVALLLAPAATPAAAADELDVLRYEIDALVADDGLHVVVAIDVVGSGDLELELAAAMRIEKADVEGVALRSTREGGRLIAKLGAAKGTSPRRLRFQVAGRPRVQFAKNRGGFVRTTVGPDIAYIRSQYAWHPRAPNDPAQYRIRVETQKDWTVHTCGVFRGRDKGLSGRTGWTFETASDVWQAGLVAGPYRTVERKTESGLTATALLLSAEEKSAARLLAVAANALTHYRKRFGKIALTGFTLVEMPDAYGTSSGYGEAGYVLIGSGAFRSAGGAPWAESLVAHEVSHQWFGQEVGFSDFISESLASYATLGFVEATAGPDAARRMRQKAIEDFVAVAGNGKGVAAADIHGFGGNMDPRVYRVHAYDEGAAMLWMIGDHAKPGALDKRLRAFIEKERGKTSNSAAVFEHVAGMSAGAAELVELWKGKDVLVLDVEATHRKARVRTHRKGRVRGHIRQTGTARPVPIVVDLLALHLDGGTETRKSVPGDELETAFSFKTPAEPDFLLVDPDYRIVAARPAPDAGREKEWVGRLIRLANNSGDRDETRLTQNLARLRLLLQLHTESEPVLHTGIGRCLFRLGRFEEATPAFETALELGAGGPFHRRWCHLRLGCIDDLAGRRKQAVEHYEKAARGKETETSVRLAKRFLERPYKGIGQDG